MQERIKICPICNLEIHGYTAVSRKDNKTKICTHCALAEALHDVQLVQQAKISETIN